ncbi:glycosyltransferase [Pseudarthrobacter psychrotolerans]|uniref:Glycosyltransferase n=1 Tax=Pseudarthrobacter psychrotolerans TaxID=2697569 RepID=A0A6P1NN16_9MICC|nr:glycosyltransferase [Pseudarthrobacter psychrotolerans]
MTPTDNVRPGISISIVTYNTWERTIKCIRSIMDGYVGGPYEILVLDNGVQPCPELTWPQHVQIHKSPKNVGFGAGHNANLLRASFDTFVILNPDVTLPGSTLQALAETVRSEGAVAAAPILVFPDGSEQLSFRSFPSLRTECARVVGADRKPDSRWSTLVRVPVGQGIVQVDQPAAAVLAVETEIMHRVGGFDTDFAMYFEDVDLCARLKSEGKILAISDHTAIHDGEGTAKSYRTATTFWIENSRRRYHRKFETGTRRTLILLATWISTLSHFVGAGLAAVISSGSQREVLFAKSRGYAAALASTVVGSDEYWRKQFLKN